MSEKRKRYRITLTEEQLRVVQKCCEMYFRLMFGQDWEFANEISGMNDMDLPQDKVKSELVFEKYLSCRNDIQELMKAVFRIAHGGVGVPDKRSDDEMIAECIWDAIRFVRGQSRWDSPLQIGPEPSPEIEVME